MKLVKLLLHKAWMWRNKIIKIVIDRGGVEDTRLEAKAKAKDTKNLRPRPRTAFPRTDPLAAKDRNAQGQGPKDTGASVLQKKVFQNFFQAISKQKKVFKIFFPAISKKMVFKKFFRRFSKEKTKKVFANFPQSFFRFPT